MLMGFVYAVVMNIPRGVLLHLPRGNSKLDCCGRWIWQKHSDNILFFARLRLFLLSVGSHVLVTLTHRLGFLIDGRQSKLDFDSHWMPGMNLVVVLRMCKCVDIMVVLLLTRCTM